MESIYDVIYGVNYGVRHRLWTLSCFVLLGRTLGLMVIYLLHNFLNLTIV